MILEQAQPIEGWVRLWGVSFHEYFSFGHQKSARDSLLQDILDWWCNLMKGDWSGWCGYWIPSFLPYSLLAILHFELRSLCLCFNFDLPSLYSIKHNEALAAGLVLFSMVEKSQTWQLTSMCCTKSCAKQSLRSGMKLKFETASQAHLGNGKEKRL